MGMGLGFFGSIIVGIIAGWLAEKIMKRDHGLMTNLIVGILGGLLGAGIMSLIGGSTGNSWILMIVVATLGACLLLWIVGLVTKKSPK
ncbi:MAG: GlsB/YeaQ/YmgE family stress response membrane protein [Corynebacterium striatum]|uniref:GlsB/YeaQ/YmgE family stress response membrane protein n=1 Tax=Corynebacterium TaxID=1716 RepID=UPI0020054184|nr:GlsB/YeaQ/YmgE family stress response membrane protein [Corynebacterium simulans]MCK6161748.1 GlsB/YeaQ/YmgE family stress response membrane protein [Corynebacterium simulans]MDU3175032.1 GlsB/YeaQ/YmgE family stress response membrane protein [Corynebacterium striatum]